MLNELEQLRRSLREGGIQIDSWHPYIKPLPKYATLLVRLDDQGVPASVSYLQREQAASLRNIQPDNQKSFPAFNLNCPIFQTPAGLDLSSPAAPVSTGILHFVPLAYKEKDGKSKDLDRLKRILRDFPAKEIVPTLAASSRNPLLSSTFRLLKVLASGQQTPEEFLRAFAEALMNAGRVGDIANGMVLDVLFGKLSKRGTREGWQCILFLDLQNIGSFSHAVADPAVAAAWSEAMLTQDQQIASEETVLCALNGERGPAIGDKMPNPNLPLLGGTYLFSMNAEILCQTRYGRTSTALFPVTRRAVQGVNDALVHMTTKALEGRTWSAVPNSTSDRSDLLIAFIEEMPDSGFAVAATLGESNAEENDEEPEEETTSAEQMALFIQRLDSLLRAIQLKAGPEARVTRHLRLFVLSTIDPGRKQVLFDARYSLERLFAARQRWAEGSANAPALDVAVFQGKGKTKRRTMDVPFPATVARSFRQLWIRGAERSERVSGVSLGRVYKLLLDPDPRKEAEWLLERFLPLKTDLLIAKGKPSRDERTGAIYDYTGAALSGPARLDLLTTSAVLGILLGLLGRAKETYMNERDYLLGQLLQFADRLQIVYCHGVRGGQVPPQLIGNSLVRQAGQNPAKALAILQQRLPVYERYATQLINSAEPVVYGGEEKDKDRARLARLKHKAWKQAPWIKARLAQLCTEVHRFGLEPASGPQGQAELLLGYLAAPPKSEQASEQARDEGDRI